MLESIRVNTAKKKNQIMDNLHHEKRTCFSEHFYSSDFGGKISSDYYIFYETKERSYEKGI